MTIQQVSLSLTTQAISDEIDNLISDGRILLPDTYQANKSGIIATLFDRIQDKVEHECRGVADYFSTPYGTDIINEINEIIADYAE